LPGTPLAECFVIRRPASAVRRKALSRPLCARYREPVFQTGANVDTRNSYHWRRQLMFGLVLVGLGGVFLLDQMDMLDIYNLWHYWPLAMVVIGLNKMIGYPSAREFTSGLWTMFIGFWLFANFENLFGLNFRNSWPYLIIGFGVTMIVKPFIRNRFAVNAPTKDSCHED
jgi:hypothetical protein